MTATADKAVKQWHARQAELVKVTDRQLAQAWAALNPGDLSRSWAAGVGARLEQVVAGGQLAAAAGATEYVTDVIGASSQPAGYVRAATLSGVASDGRPLSSLLYQSIIRAKQAIGLGAAVDEALAGAMRQLLMLGGTQVLDAGRAATSVAITADRAAVGYVRFLNPPSCARCTVLAGRVYRHSTGFRRHPRCDCQMQPVENWDRAAHQVEADPRKSFDALTPRAQDDLFTRAGAQAIRDGADIGQVVNARRGMFTATWGSRQVAATSEGITVHGLAGQRLTAGIAGKAGAVRNAASLRLMPEQIYLEAGSDRDEAIRLLKRYGYLI